LALLIASAPQERPRGPIQDGAAVARAVDTYLANGEGGRSFAAMLQSEDPKERFAANLVLFNTGEPRFAARLVRLFADPDWRMARVAYMAARRFPDAAWPVLTEFAKAGNPAVFPMLREFGPPGMAEIRKHIHHPSAPARVAALTQLEDLSEWRKASFDPDPIVYGRAAGRLAAYPGATRVFAFTHPRVEVRREALKRVQRGTGTTVDEYVLAARDRDPWVRALALPELGRIASNYAKVTNLPEAIGIVGKALADPHPAVRDSAVRAVAQWFEHWETTKETWGGHAVQAALRTLGQKASRDALWERASLPITRDGEWKFFDLNERGAVFALANVGDNRALAVLSRKDVGNPQEILPALGDLRTPECRTWLSSQLDRILADFQASRHGLDSYDRDGAILLAAIRLTDHEMLARLRAVVRDGNVELETRIGMLHLISFGQRGKAEAFLIGLLEDRREVPAIRSSAALALDHEPSPSAIAALRRAAQDPDASVARAAVVALDAIAAKRKGG